MKRLISFLLAFVLLLGMMPTVMAASPFSDVPADAYYYDAVLWAVEQGVTTGTGNGKFSPLMNCTRSQVVTFLWRAAGSPEPSATEMSFSDVPADAYYYDAVLWAVEKNITTGTGNGKFSPLMDCSRAQIVTFLWRSQGSPAVSGVENPFTDVPAGQYYTDAVLWAVKEGITTGTAADKFSPDMICTRSQIVTFLYRCMGSSSDDTTPLTIDAQPCDVECKADCDVVFVVAVSGGTPGYTYQWWYDTDNIEPREMSEADTWATGWDTEEAVVSVYASDFAEHLMVWCVITDAKGQTITSEKATVTEAFDPLLIIDYSDDAIAVCGEVVSFYVTTFGGKGNLTYDWQYKNDSMEHYASIGEVSPPWASGFDTDTLQLVLAQEHFDQNYRFRCVVEDELGQSATSYEMDVVKALHITQQPETILVHPNGGSHSYHVGVDGETGPYTYQWQYRHKGDPVFSNIDEFTRAFCTGFNTDTLELDIYSNDFERESKFRCVITSNTTGEEVISDEVGIEKKLYIEYQPQDVTVEAGETAIFSVVAGGGSGDYTYQWEWTCDGEEVYYRFTEEPWATGFDTADLSVTVKDVDFTEGYRYRCVITDESGQSVVSEPAGPVEHLELQFRTQPQDREAIPGEWAFFSVEVVGGLPSYSYQWMVRSDGMGMAVPIDETDADWATGYNTAELAVRLDQDQFEDHYRFFCVVSDEEGYGDITSDAAYLTERFHISSQPANAAAYEDMTASFNVGIRGQKIPEAYYWQYSTDGGITYENITEEEDWATDFRTNTLQVKATDYIFNVGYSFRCKIVDNSGTEIYTDEVRVVPLQAPVIETQPEDVRVEIGEKAVFTVKVKGGVPPYQYQWYEYSADTMEWIIVPHAKSDTLTMEMDASHRDSFCRYRCEITDDSGMKVTTRAATPVFSLAIKTEPTDAYVKSGDFVAFTADVTGGEGGYTYQWYTKGSGAYFTLASGEKFSGADSATISFFADDVDLTVKRTFQCKITDSAGNEIKTKEVRVYPAS